MIHSSTPGVQPVWPDQKDGRKVEEPADVEDFVAMLLANLRVAAATNLGVLIAFRRDPRESLHMPGTRFDLITLPLEENNLMTPKMLALALTEHLPNTARDKITIKRIKQDEDRAKMGEELTNRDELMRLARAEESRVLKLEAEMRAAGV